MITNEAKSRLYPTNDSWQHTNYEVYYMRAYSSEIYIKIIMNTMIYMYI